MERQALDRRSLVELLNFELAAYEECDGCRFTSMRDWSEARVQSDHELGVEEQFIVQHVLAQTRREFDLAA